MEETFVDPFFVVSFLCLSFRLAIKFLQVERRISVSKVCWVFSRVFSFGVCFSSWMPYQDRAELPLLELAHKSYFSYSWASKKNDSFFIFCNEGSLPQLA